MRPTQHIVLEAEIELTAQELLAPLESGTVIEIDDIVAAEMSHDSAGAANTDEAQREDALQETSEIELTPDQMDAMLEGRWP
jgi:hypothetical protein